MRINFVSKIAINFCLFGKLKVESICCFSGILQFAFSPRIRSGVSRTSGTTTIVLECSCKVLFSRVPRCLVPAHFLKLIQ